MADLFSFLLLIQERFFELLYAPVANQEMLWFAVPLAISTLFMTLYMGKYPDEDLGWNSAFENTTVFLFVALDLMRQMYYSTSVGSWNNLFSNSLYFSVSLFLIVIGSLFVIITFYHLFPKKWAFLLFSKPPISVTLYVAMTLIYTGVPADLAAGIAGLILFGILYFVLTGIQSLEHVAGREDGIDFIKKKAPETLAEKFKKKAEEARLKKEKSA